MLTLLTKLFIKDSENTENSTVRSQYGSLCGVLGIILNILLFALKLIAGPISGAIAMMSNAVNNPTDAGSSLITLIGFRLSEQKPDRDHPFGHGRIEYVSGLIVSMLISLSALSLDQHQSRK
jgi:cation diffusion facilitator family transporter